MKHTWVSRVGMVTLVSGLVLSISLVVTARDAGAASPDKGGASTTDLSGVMQNWDKKLSGTARFTVLSAFNNEAVRDNETGLVWEQSPQLPEVTWVNARIECTGKATGGRKGWRLPSVHELASLIDPTQTAPALPLNHPFTNSSWSGIYQTATMTADDPNSVWLVLVYGGVISSGGKGLGRLWCVRGGMNAEVY